MPHKGSKTRPGLASHDPAGVSAQRRCVLAQDERPYIDRVVGPPSLLVRNFSTMTIILLGVPVELILASLVSSVIHLDIDILLVNSRYNSIVL